MSPSLSTNLSDQLDSETGDIKNIIDVVNALSEPTTLILDVAPAAGDDAHPALTVQGSLQVLSHITLKFMNGAVMKIVNEGEAVIYGHIEAGLFKIFDCEIHDDKVPIKICQGYVFPEWFGAKADYDQAIETDCGPAINKAIRSITYKHGLHAGVVEFRATNYSYLVNTQITVPNPTYDLILRGYGATLVTTKLFDYVIKISDTVADLNCERIVMEGIHIIGNHDTNSNAPPQMNYTNGRKGHYCNAHEIWLCTECNNYVYDITEGDLLSEIDEFTSPVNFPDAWICPGKKSYSSGISKNCTAGKDKLRKVEKWYCIECLQYLYDELIGDVSIEIKPGTAPEDFDKNLLCPKCSVKTSLKDSLRKLGPYGMSGIYLGQTVNCVLRDVKIEKVLGVGIVGETSEDKKANYRWTNLFDNVNVYGTGEEAIRICVSEQKPADELTMLSCIFNSICYNIAIPEEDILPPEISLGSNRVFQAGVMIYAHKVTGDGIEISDCRHRAGVGGVRVGMYLKYIREGNIAGIHFEFCGNNQGDNELLDQCYINEYINGYKDGDKVRYFDKEVSRDLHVEYSRGGVLSGLGFNGNDAHAAKIAAYICNSCNVTLESISIINGFSEEEWTFYGFSQPYDTQYKYDYGLIVNNCRSSRVLGISDYSDYQYYSSHPNEGRCRKRLYYETNSHNVYVHPSTARITRIQQMMDRVACFIVRSAARTLGMIRYVCRYI